MRFTPNLRQLLSTAAICLAAAITCALAHSAEADFSAVKPGAVLRTSLTPEELSAPQNVFFTLRIRNLERLKSRVNAGEVLTPEQLIADHMPSEAEWQSVADWAKGQGLRILQEDPAHLTVFASGTVQQVQTALQVRFARVVDGDLNESTRAITEPAMPAAIAGHLSAIRGLQSPVQANAPSADAGSIDRAGSDSLTGQIMPQQIRTLYNAGTLSGQGETIVILGGSSIDSADLTAFWTSTGQATTLAQYSEYVPPGSTLGTLLSEDTMDVEWASAMAPSANIIHFGAADAGLFLTWLIGQLNAGVPIHQASLSAGLEEARSSIATSQTQYYAAIAALGVTFFASSGDYGSNSAAGFNVGGAYDPAGPLSPSYPASDPFVTCVGGTIVDSSSGALKEYAWTLPVGKTQAESKGFAASTGGLSAWFTAPTWQVGTNIPTSGQRACPDVAAVAGAGSGVYMVFKGTVYSASGTSLSSPVWSGLCALLNQARRQAGQAPLGLLSPKLYPLEASTGFQAITQGMALGDLAASTAATNGAYSLTAGYNMVTGLGSPDIGQLSTALLQPSATGSAPVITTQPVSAVINLGDTVSFTVVATGDPAPSYYWVGPNNGGFGGGHFPMWPSNVTVTGTNTNKLTLSNVRISDTSYEVANFQAFASYSAIAYNRYGVAVSNDVHLSVNLPKPVINTQPANVTAIVGQSATFSVSVSGGMEPLTYQWKKLIGNTSWESIPGATSSSYTLNNLQASDAGTYEVWIYDKYTDVLFSNPATLTVQNAGTAPAITTQPAAVAVTAGQKAMFTVAASGTNPLSYQWYLGKGAIAGATSSSYIISAAAATDAGDYSVVVTNAYGSTTSNAATLTVQNAGGGTAPTITTQPAAQSATAGGSVSFSVGASGTSPFTYQWRKDGVNIAGATASSYSIASVAAGDAGTYSVVVSNPAGSATSNGAALTVQSGGGGTGNNGGAGAGGGGGGGAPSGWFLGALSLLIWRRLGRRP